MRAFIEWIISLFCKPTFPAFPSECRGWGWVNQWATDPDTLIDTLADNGCNATHIELLMWGILGLYDDNNINGRDWIFDQLEKLLNRARRRGVFVGINLTNYNVGDTKYPENGTVPLSRFDDAWFRRLVLRTVESVRLAGMHDHVAIGACSEWTDKRYERWNQILFELWDGHRLWNRNSRPATAPAGFAIEHHPIRADDYGPPNSFVVGDTGTFISAFGEFRGHVTRHAALSDYASTCNAKGNGFIFYCFNDGGKGIDVDACKVIGKQQGD
jgi:hypothetical protein